MEKDQLSARPLLSQEQQSQSHSDDSDVELLMMHRCRGCSSRKHRWSWAGQILLFCASAALFMHSRFVDSTSSGERCVERLSAFSPALASVSDSYDEQRFRGTVLGETEMKGPPTPERLALWDAQVVTDTFRIDDAERQRIGAPASAVQYPPELGGGYVAWLETYHHLHCLQHLWMNTYDIQPEARNHSSAHRQHLDHCADLLRQKFACDADVTVVTFSWVQQFDHYTPNFNTLHKCRREPDVRDWLHAHHVDRKGITLTKPADAIVLDELP